MELYPHFFLKSRARFYMHIQLIERDFDAVFIKSVLDSLQHFKPGLPVILLFYPELYRQQHATVRQDVYKRQAPTRNASFPTIPRKQPSLRCLSDRNTDNIVQERQTMRRTLPYQCPPLIPSSKPVSYTHLKPWRFCRQRICRPLRAGTNYHSYHNLQQTPHNIHFLKGAVSYLLPFFCFYKNFINLAGF